MNFILIKDYHINLDNIIEYHTYERHSDGYPSTYWIMLKTILNTPIEFKFPTEKERNDALQKLDEYTGI